jgi:hypothetical protein
VKQAAQEFIAESNEAFKELSHMGGDFVPGNAEQEALYKADVKKSLSKAQELQKLAELEATKEAASNNDKAMVGNKSLLKSTAFNSPLAKYGRSSRSPQSTSSPPPSPMPRKKNKISKRQSIQVSSNKYSFSDKDIEKSAVKVSKRSSMHEDEDFDIARKMTLFADMIDTELERAIPKEGSRDIPGLSKYPSGDTHLYLPLIRIEEIKKWSQLMSEWYGDVEQKWKKSKSALCITFLQRARLLLNGGERYRQLLADDASLAAVLKSANALDLVELLCCRRTLILRVCFKISVSLSICIFLS